ncbi:MULTISPECIES: methionine ABC transporter permease [Streptomyces]|uniref:ABC transporter permease n=1 Tax=Streptomyces morookaense TaxID=1970 RepID=A0A7Y7B966_STRMO|nr:MULTISPECIES: methionine ABC transporter permease [Streptomyces]MCC2276458.1 ABC transporter permease [Streptomyces sp. ET3-23]NVK81306.1 ABC transporter permease [Streptomyces morookaense]GHF52088.1 ABC transporter permease [Streptomyces morookaense]
MTWTEMQPLLRDACLDTLFMVWWSTVYAVVGGLPLGILLVLTDRGALLQNVVVNKVLGAVVNLGRSLPFIILLVWLIPFSRLLIGTSIGPSAAVVALTIGAIPFFARLVETAVREVDHGLVEAVQSMGGSTWTVVLKVLLPQALPSLVAGLTTTVIALIGYSAMAGAVGGGGLGNLAITYGYMRHETGLMNTTIVLLIVIVTLVQLAGDLVVRSLSRRGGRQAAPVGLRRLRRRAATAPVAAQPVPVLAEPAEAAETP